MLALILKADVDIGIAMYQALLSSEARRDALKAAAVEGLSTEDLLLFNAVMKVIKPSRDRRNEFAHHIWGDSPDIPGALLLADPRVITDILVGHDLHRMVKNAGAYRPKVDKSKIYVFKEKTLIEDAEASSNAGTYVATMFEALSGNARSDERRQWLLSEPRVQQALEKLTSETPK